MRLVSTKNIFLSTRNRNEGTSFAPIFQLPVGAVKCKENQSIKMTLIRWSCFVGWNNVNSSNDNFAFINDDTGVTTSITLTNGNYPYSKLAKLITAAYPEVTCTYNAVTNKLEFQFTVPHTIQFTDDSFHVLGFENGYSMSTDDEFKIVSPGLLKGRACDRILITLDGVSPSSDANLENVTSTQLKITNILAAITITAGPYTYQNYINPGDEMGLFIADKSVQKLIFTFEDGSTGEAAEFMDGFESELVLKVDVYQTDDSSHQNVTLSQIKEYLRLQLLTTHLGGAPDKYVN